MFSAAHRGPDSDERCRANGGHTYRRVSHGRHIHPGGVYGERPVVPVRRHDCHGAASGAYGHYARVVLRGPNVAGVTLAIKPGGGPGLILRPQANPK